MGSIEEVTTTRETPTKVLIIGGCYGGLSAALNILDLCRGERSRGGRHLPDDNRPGSVLPIGIKIVDERDGFYHIIGSPLALAEEDYAQKAWKKYDEIPALQAPEISFTQGTATAVDCERKIVIIKNTLTREKSEEKYDYLVVSTGLRRDWPTVPQALTKKEYMAEIISHAQAARSAQECTVVIGGGAVGIEMAAELKLVEPSLNVKLIQSRDKLLFSEPLPDSFKDRTAAVLRESGIDLILGRRVNEIRSMNKENERPLYNLQLSDGSEILAGHVISAISNGVPSTTFLSPKSCDEQGYVHVDPTMNFKYPSPNAESHFAVGDIVVWSGIKRCGAAMSMGHIAAVNIHQRLLKGKFGIQPKFAEFPQYPPMIALAVGKQAVVYGEADGTTWGEDLMKVYFGEDLGFTACWDYLGLSRDSSGDRQLRGIRKPERIRKSDLFQGSDCDSPMQVPTFKEA